MENMMNTHDPFYKKVTTILVGLVVAVYILYVLADLLIPLAFAVLFSVLLNPLFNRFKNRGVPKVLAILLTLLVALLGVAAVFYFLSTQILQFGEMLPTLKTKTIQLLTDLQHWIQATFGLDIDRQVQYLNDIANSNKALVGNTLSGALGMFSVIFLLPVYIFLLLFYKTLIITFFYEVFSKKSQQSVADILHETKAAIQSYIVGLLTETLIVAVLNSAALLLLGVPYAILIGVIGAILNLIPYIGGIVAILLPVIMATVTMEGYTTQLLVIAAYAVIQFIDNNLIVPRVVSSKVQINALVSILAVLLGGALWGVSGMFLSIPFIAVLKIIFDRVNDLKPWGKLLGDDIPVKPMQLKWRDKDVKEHVVTRQVKKPQK